MSVQRKTTILAVAVLAAAVGGYFYFHRAPKLTEALAERSVEDCIAGRVREIGEEDRIFSRNPRS